MTLADRLAEIQARADNATDGPWEPDGQDSWTPAGRSDFHLSISDAEFIAHARTDVPALIAALCAALDAGGTAVHQVVAGTLTH